MYWQGIVCSVTEKCRVDIPIVELGGNGVVLSKLSEYLEIGNSFHIERVLPEWSSSVETNERDSTALPSKKYFFVQQSLISQPSGAMT